MATGALQDASVGFVPESVYGTPLTPTRWYEHIDENFDYEKVIKQGQGLRVGSRIARSGRRAIVETQATGDLTVEYASKGMGMLLTACIGSGVSTLVSGSTYQQLFTIPATTNPPAYTVQKSVVQAGGQIDPYTYTGGVVSTWEMSCPTGDLVTLKSTWDFRDVSLATAYATPSYPAAPVNLFNFSQGSITVGGAVTAPSSVALATGGTAVANVRDFNLKVDNKILNSRFNFNAGGKKAQPTYGLRVVTGQITIEYTDQTLINAYIADTPLALTLTFTTGTALSVGSETLQIVLPEIKLNGALPNSNGTDLITLPISFDVLDNLTASQPIWVVQRTADSAL